MDEDNDIFDMDFWFLINCYVSMLNYEIKMWLKIIVTFYYFLKFHSSRNQ